MRRWVLIMIGACSLACAQVIEVESVERSGGYGGPCVVGSICANGLSCQFGYCPLVDAGTAPDASSGAADAAQLPEGVCGDGVLNRGEACDDANDAHTCKRRGRVWVCGLVRAVRVCHHSSCARSGSVTAQ